MKKLLLYLCVCFSLSLTAQISKTVTGSHDADGLKFQGENKHYRLLGCDAPEIYSPFVTKTQPMGIEAGNYLRTWLKGKTVFVTEHPKVDVYGRKLITVIYDGKDVVETLIANGMAHYFYSLKLKKEQRDRYKAAETFAKLERVGVWSQKDSTGNYITPILPSVWRKTYKGYL